MIRTVHNQAAEAAGEGWSIRCKKLDHTGSSAADVHTMVLILSVVLGSAEFVVGKHEVERSDDAVAVDLQADWVAYCDKLLPGGCRYRNGNMSTRHRFSWGSSCDHPYLFLCLCPFRCAGSTPEHHRRLYRARPPIPYMWCKGHGSCHLFRSLLPALELPF